MKSWLGLAMAATLCLETGCGGVNGTAAPATCSVKKDRVGNIYKDLNDFDPPEARTLRNDAELAQAITDLRRRIFFAGGPNALDKAADVCENSVEALLCPVSESVRVLETVRKFSEAVNKCYEGDRLPDGRPDPEKEGRMDLECFLSSTKDLKEPMKTDPKMGCLQTIYDCEKKQYLELKKSRAAEEFIYK